MNDKIKKYAKRNHVALWKIASRLGIHENTFNKRLHKQLTEDEEKEYREIIDAIAKEEASEND